MTLQTLNVICGGHKAITLSCDKATLEVFLSGASIHNYQVHHSDGRTFSPFAEASWLDDYRDVAIDGVPRHLQLIGGEFPCVPFGKTTFDKDHHGYGVNNEWQLIKLTGHHVELEIDFPDDHIIHRIRRSISLCENTGALDIWLEIEVRKDCKIPIGVHPIFKIPIESGELKIEPPDFERGAFAPKTLHQDKQIADDQSTFLNLNSDIWSSIVGSNTKMFQLWNVTSDLSLEYTNENYIVELKWDTDRFPHCLFWIANPDLKDVGLGDGFVGLGIEPTNSFFDVNDKANEFLSLHNQGLNSFGVNLKADELWKTNYKISCREMAMDISENIK